jgi:hypothetical protein
MTRHVRFTTLAGLALLALLPLAAAAAAQEPSPPFTYVAEWTIARDQWQGYVEWGAKNTRPVLERLAAEGTLLDWGFYETYVHETEGNTHGLWWTAASIANIEKARAALIKAPFHPAAAAGAHRDYLLRSMAGGSRPGATSGGFLYVNMQEVRAGQGEAWEKFFEKYSKPVLDDLVAKGVLASWGVQYEDVHTAPNSMRFVVTVSNSPEAEDQADAAFGAARAKLSEAERSEYGRLARELTVPESHRDYLARINAAWFK